MYQDIKNFSQITDIDNNLSLQIKIKLHRNPKFKFLINNKEITFVNNSYKIQFVENLHIVCKKEHNTSAIEIISLSVNDFEILPKYLHLANPQTHWIEKCDFWEFKIPYHFYAWYQEITGLGEIF